MHMVTQTGGPGRSSWDASHLRLSLDIHAQKSRRLFGLFRAAGSWASGWINLLVR